MPISPIDVALNLTGFWLLFLVPVGVLAVGLVSLSRRQDLPIPISSIGFAIGGVVSLGLAGVGLYLKFGVLSSIFSNAGLLPPRLVFLGFLYALATAATVCLAAATSVSILRSRRLSGGQVVLLTLAALAFGNLCEVVPDFNARHTWWALPLGLVAAFVLMERAMGKELRTWAHPLVVPMVLTAVLPVFLVPRTIAVVLHDMPMLAGTRIADGMVPAYSTSGTIEAEYAFLEQALHSRPAVFFTRRYDLLVSQGKYGSLDRFPFCIRGRSLDFGTAGTPVVLDRESEDSVHCPISAIAKVLLARGYEEVAVLGSLSVWRDPRAL